MPLRGGPKSLQALALIEDLISTVVLPREPRTRPTSRAKMKLALGALLSDLFRYRSGGRDGKHGFSPKDFPSAELGFGRDIFVPIKDALVERDLLQFKKGWKRVEEGFFGKPVRSGGDLAFFRLTPKLLEKAGSVARDRWSEHWRAGTLMPVEPKGASLIALRAAKKEGGEKGAELNFSNDEPNAALALRDLEAANAFLRKAQVEGIAFAGLRRIFNDGDVPGKRWRRGGRFYSLPGGDAYETMGGEERRALIRFAGEAVAEVDISASHLTILYAIHSLPFDPCKEDPYSIPGIRRAVVKAWVTMSLGRAAVESNRWSSRAKQAYEEEHPGGSLSAECKVPQVRRAVIKKHPILHELAENEINSLDLQWHEADILRIAMYDLRKGHGVPSLPVHDSLIVPVSQVELAKRALRRGFMFHFEKTGIEPRLAVKGPSLSDENLTS